MSWMGLQYSRCLALPVLDSMDRPFESPPDMLTEPVVCSQRSSGRIRLLLSCREILLKELVVQERLDTIAADSNSPG